ncbi:MULTISPECIES: RNA polymerase sigma factor SigJ [unclassified Streptomyces]|uniref:RNA polymerase sigma factor SigJ n=1 Tax=unclassified Streptomyces TaxID=2593676 RepID=UPI00088638FC|nr:MULTISPECIES: RNA polymerase sigma factor SigJ [unclassified Streptomyces]PBC84161.1 RNA polymerase sigma-70 factor (ECF subfamily) [Streptomyces sp. 2321.6]SDR34328.1 RNA polymerase sigma-70 factor, ECF subfamily [Streptomyces sp. KS_16]SED21875.1 RNA polymerase sigma-70 factor, ECF subfamily [Streptomyces sp. 2133.1]SNC70243.1 RNA polymerase sigma-70 factor, ECF subfamily [Streptomyces sp. 2114.4]
MTQPGREPEPETGTETETGTGPDGARGARDADRPERDAVRLAQEADRPAPNTDRLAQFEEQRGRLWAIAYRIMGTVTDADDAVQEAWLRWQALPDDQPVASPRGFLTTVVSRICYDLLGSARARRETYVGPWLPEPLLDGTGGRLPLVAAGAGSPGSPGGPEDRVTLDESVGMALLTVMERLTPAERTAFILHDVFAVPFPEIAEAVGRTPESVRQLASRARKRVRAEAPRRTVDRAEHRRTVEAFLSAVMGGDFDALLSVLDPEIVWRSDGGGKVSSARRPVLGREKVARYVRGLVTRGAQRQGLRVALAEVNGATGLVFVDPVGEQAGVFAFTVHAGRITEVDAVINPDKLGHLDLGLHLPLDSGPGPGPNSDRF